MKQFVSEFIGTFVFMLVILYATAPNAQWPNLAPFLIVGGLLSGIVLSATGSGGHLNPAVSFMMYLKGSLSVEKIVEYMGAQLLGALAAVVVKSTIDKLV